MATHRDGGVGFSIGAGGMEQFRPGFQGIPDQAGALGLAGSTLCVGLLAECLFDRVKDRDDVRLHAGRCEACAILHQQRQRLAFHRIREHHLFYGL